MTALNKLRKSAEYKKQRLFVVCDCGAAFKNRFGVIGLPSGLFKLTRYFKTEREACAYFRHVAVAYADFQRPYADQYKNLALNIIRPQRRRTPFHMKKRKGGA